MPSNERVTIRTGSLQGALEAYCERTGQTPSQVLRDALAAWIDSESPAMPAGNPAFRGDQASELAARGREARTALDVANDIEAAARRKRCMRKYRGLIDRLRQQRATTGLNRIIQTAKRDLGI
jgi:hypothetical protein